MAKPTTQRAGLRARSAAPVKSSVKAPPRKAVAKKPPVSRVSVKPAATKTSSSSRVAPPPAKAVVKKAAPAKGAPVKAVPAKSAPAKTLPAKAPAAKTKTSSSAEQSPATEAEIMGAVSGKLTGKSGGKGFSWLGGRAAPAPAAEKPKTEVPKAEEPRVEAVVILEEEIPAPAVIMEPVAVVVMEEAPVAEGPVAEAPEVTETVVVLEPVALLVEVPAGDDAVAAEATPPVEEAPPATAVETPATVTLSSSAIPSLAEDEKDEVALAAEREEALIASFKDALRHLGWTLALQGLVFIAFCVLVKGGVPLKGLPQFLAVAIPVFAMLMVVGALLSFQASQRVLEQLEARRQRGLNLLSGEGDLPDTVPSQRRAALLPGQIILGVLFLAWLFIGFTVWFL